jgi:hypothetical protein
LTRARSKGRRSRGPSPSPSDFKRRGPWAVSGW